MASVPIPPERAADRPLVSPASILILSAFLAGIAFADALPRSGKTQAICAASAGVAAYLGLWYTSRLQDRLDTERDERKTVRRIERRLGRFVRTRASLATGPTRRPRHRPGR